MSRRLVLIRHAKAQGAHPRGDHERELAERGPADAAALGRWLGEQGLSPDHVIVSTAARAQQTLGGLADGVGEVREDATVWPERRIYDGGVDGVLAAVAESPDEAQVVWVVGHEPVMSTTTWELADRQASDAELLHELSSGFPTATASVLELDEVWGAAGYGSARLVSLHTGRADG